MARGIANLTYGGRRRRGFALSLPRPLLLMLVAMAVSGCPAGRSGNDNASSSPTGQNTPAPEPAAPAGREHPAFGEMVQQRAAMVEWQIEARRISDPNVLQAMRTVPRHVFVPAEYRSYAYGDRPLPIGHGQTISQPYIVAFMTEALKLNRGSVVLEIGTGSGYQAAVAAEIAGEVYTIEIVESLAKSAAKLLTDLGYTNIHVKAGDGYRGWPEQGPFDAIIGTAAAGHVPPALVEQLKNGGRMILPVAGEPGLQYLVLLTKSERGELHQERLMPVMFVPMAGDIDRSKSGG